MAARLLSRLSAAEAPPPWGLLTAVNSIVIAYVLILMGTFLGTYFVGANALALQISWLTGCVLIVGFVSLSRRRDRAALRLEANGASLILVLLFSLGMAIALDVLSLGATRRFLPVPELSSLTQPPAGAVAWVAAILLMVVAQPIAEEQVFRGITLPALRHALGSWAGLVVCALAYAVFHQLAYSSPGDDSVQVWYGLALPFLVGLVISGVRAYTGSTRAAIVSHMAFGLFAVLKALTLAG
jgi:membrane protease YdiL (CAAX protease family)